MRLGAGGLSSRSADTPLFTYPGVRTRCYSHYAGPCEEGPYHFRAGSLSNPCDVFHFWSLHSQGSHFLFADGSVHFLTYAADAILPALATRAGGESVAVP